MITLQIKEINCVALLSIGFPHFASSCNSTGNIFLWSLPKNRTLAQLPISWIRKWIFSILALIGWNFYPCQRNSHCQVVKSRTHKTSSTKLVTHLMAKMSAKMGISNRLSISLLLGYICDPFGWFWMWVDFNGSFKIAHFCWVFVLNPGLRWILWWWRMFQYFWTNALSFYDWTSIEASICGPLAFCYPR